jgi:hypothetical protein
VLKLDVKNFFTSTTERRVHEFFRQIGWDVAAADALVRLCSHRGSLPQGAPTSPRLTNLVNFRLDARLSALAEGFLLHREPGTGPPGRQRMIEMPMAYTRYADDITFSFAADEPAVTHAIIRIVKAALSDYGYRLHERAKLQIRRRHERQMVCGMVVNDHVQLPRQTRRRLRAMRHRLKTGRSITISSEQLKGWDSLAHMIEMQSTDE